MAAPNADRDAVPPDPDEPGVGPSDTDRRFADIVRDFGDMPPDHQGDGTSSQPPSAEPRRADSFPVAPWVRPAGPRDWPTTPDVEALEDEQSHFTPADPGPVLGRDPLLTVAWTFTAGAPLVILVLAIAVRPFPALIGPVLICAFLAGLATLIWRMPRERDPEDHDPGAVV